MALDIHPWSGIGPLRFGMKPAEVRCALEEEEKYEQWMGGNLNGSILYHGLILGFGDCNSKGPLETSEFCEAKICGREDVQLFGKRLWSWERKELVAYAESERWCMWDGPASDLDIVDLALGLGFDSDGRVVFAEVDQPRVVVMQKKRTSETHPIAVNWLPGGLPGRLGLTFAPGKRSTSKYGGSRWHRDLAADLDRLTEHAGCQVLVCLLEDHELVRYGIPELIEEASSRGINVLRLPIPDGGVLPELEPIRELVDKITSHLTAGQNVVVHCAGGLGRTGTVAGCWLVSQGMLPDKAIETLHRVRSPNCPETREQERFISHFAKRIVADGRDRALSPVRLLRPGGAEGVAFASGR